MVTATVVRCECTYCSILMNATQGTLLRARSQFFAGPDGILL